MKEMGPAGRLWRLYKMGGITSAVTSVFDNRSAQQIAFIRSVMKEQRQGQLLEMPLAKLEAVVADLETTGFSPYSGDEIISIGAVRVTGAGVAEEGTFYTEVNPKRTIPEEIVRLTGITNEQAACAPELIDALRNFLEFVGKRLLLVHGSSHDKSFLNSALWRTSKIALTHRLLDTMMIAKWLHPRLSGYGLDELLALYQIPLLKRHHALDDALMTAQLWLRMLPELQARDAATLSDLYEALS